VVNQHTLVNALRDHERFYFLGGSATWGNIRGILQSNIANLHVYEEGNYQAERADGWGVTDLALFDKALAVLKERKKPFFAFIQTSGNHRPYTIPEDKSGFALASLDEKALAENGFDSLAAYNGLRYLDFALGQFFERVRREPYFRNTVFVMYGDHGNPSASPTPWEQLKLTGVHVPFVIYAPGLFRQGRHIDTAASLVDLLPTSLSLMKVPYRNTTLGRDLLSPRPAAENFAFLPFGILNDEFLLQFGADGQNHLFRYRSSAPTLDVLASRPDVAARLLDLREAFFQTALYLLYHNPPRPHAPDSR
jgi:phosphoglycerol transferase MdoB-like AlkP superfamily enzyme